MSEARAASPVEWDSIWSECRYSTYFHSREWAELWERYNRGKSRPSPILLTFPDGKRALLPYSLLRMYKGAVVGYVSSPAGTFGGWISADDLDERHVSLIDEYEKKHIRNLTLRVNPYNELLTRTTVGGEQDETQALRLSDGLDTLAKRFSKGHRSAITAAKARGVSVEVAGGLDDWIAYYGAYEDSLKRWGPSTSARYRWPLFEDIFHLASPSIRLWLAKHEGEVLAGALCLYSPTHVVYWHGAAFEAAFSLRPTHLVLYVAIEDAIERDYSWFDFNPSGGHTGVRAFKSHFGPISLPCPVVRTTSMRRRIVRRLAVSTTRWARRG